MSNKYLTLKAIRSELYSAISLKEYESKNLDIIISDIAYHYYIFKKTIKTIFQNKISFELQKTNILFNDIIFYNCSSDKIYFHYTSFKEGGEDRLTSLLFSGALGYSETLGFYPKDGRDIKFIIDSSLLLGKENIDSSNIFRNIQKYIYDDLKMFNNSYIYKIPELNEFIINFSKIILSLEKSGVSVDTFFVQKNKYKKIELYKILNDSKETILLFTDNDIEENLNKLSKNL